MGVNIMMDVRILLFDGFETLDAMGPAEVFGMLPELYRVTCCSLGGGVIKSSQNVSVLTVPITEAGDILLVPGGFGVRALVKDEGYVAKLKELCEASQHVLTVCTGSVLLAQTGLLFGRQATSYKISFDWASSHGDNVDWRPRARWTVDWKYRTSSGISAGIDMALGFVSDMHGRETALETARKIEYVWNDCMDNDPFAADGNLSKSAG